MYSFAFWIILLNILFVRFIHTVACIIALYLLHKYSLFIHFTVNAHLSCFQLYVVINRVAMNILVLVFC